MAHRFHSFRQAGQLRLLLEALTAPAADRPRWMTFVLWATIPLMLLAPVGIGFWAVTELFGLPALPRCFTVSWTDDNFASRLYCAKAAADRRTPQALQDAIELVRRIPNDDPQRPERDRLMRQWSDELLRQGEAKFQEGDLDAAIEIAERIPLSAPTRSLADDRIQQWRDSWNKATTLYDDAKLRLAEKDWYGVLAAARQLLTLGNRYWATTQHEELMRQMQAAKSNDEDHKIEATRDRKPAATQTPTFLTNLQQEQAANARTQLSKARSLASAGTVDALQAAISEAQQVIFGTEGYDEAQAAIDSWRQQIEQMEDRPILERALALANQGDESSLQAAIVEASQIGWGRSLYKEANDYVEQWRDRLFQLQSEARTRQLEGLPGGRFFSHPYQPASLPEPSAAEPLPDSAGFEPAPPPMPLTAPTTP